MTEELTRTEPVFRFNVKQSAKGEIYGEFTVRGETKEEIAERAEAMSELLKKFSTVVRKG